MLPQRMGIKTGDRSPVLSAAPMTPVRAFQLRRGSAGNSAAGLSERVGTATRARTH
jgi:hypothetical protein